MIETYCFMLRWVREKLANSSELANPWIRFAARILTDPCHQRLLHNFSSCLKLSEKSSLSLFFFLIIRSTSLMWDFQLESELPCDLLLQEYEGTLFCYFVACGLSVRIRATVWRGPTFCYKDTGNFGLLLCCVLRTETLKLLHFFPFGRVKRCGL